MKRMPAPRKNFCSSQPNNRQSSKEKPAPVVKRGLSSSDKLKLALMVISPLIIVGLIVLIVTRPPQKVFSEFACYACGNFFTIENKELPEDFFIPCPDCEAIIPKNGKWSGAIDQARQLRKKGHDFFDAALKEPDLVKRNGVLDKSIAKFREARKIYEAAREANPQTYFERELNELLSASKAARFRKVRK
ncbi:MAG: hypothetical protein KAS70_00530 [Planctomycetes bacterium]|nr:hypothetical protein [Planctomycetota bacterium]